MSEELVDAEKSVLGSVLLKESVLEQVLEVVRPEDFSTLLGQRVMATFLAMRADSVPIDATTALDYALRDEVIRRAGGGVVLHDLHSHVPTWTNAVHYARVVAREATRRRAEVALTRGLQYLSRHQDPAAALETVAAEVLSAAGRVEGEHWLGDSLDQWRAALDEPVTYLPTPWPSLNHLIGGWAPGRFYIVAARPGVGKTLMALQAATELARDGVAYLASLEMSLEEIQTRVVANLADVSLGALQAHQVTPGEQLRVDAAVTEMKGLRVAVDDRVDVSILDVAAQARAVARRQSLSAVFIDYVQLLGGTGADSRREDVAAASRQCKLLARDLQVPVIALSQLNRNPQGRPSRTPEVSDLKDSGALEQDADVVLLMSRRLLTDPETGEEYESPTEVSCNVAKNRHGPQGRFGLIQDGEFARMRNPTMAAQGRDLDWLDDE